MMKSNIRHLASKSARIYELTMLERFTEEFEKQQQIQKIKFALITTSFATLFVFAILAPIRISRYLSQILI